MTRLSGSLRVLILRFANAACVTLANDVLAIDEDDERGRLPQNGMLIDLAAYLPPDIGKGQGQKVRLLVHAGGRLMGFRTDAALQVHDACWLYRLPRFIRDTGCADWVRGIALLGDAEASPTAPAPDDAVPAIWIDLRRLGSAFEHNSMEEVA
jgi:hypothetical protein